MLELTEALVTTLRELPDVLVTRVEPDARIGNRTYDCVVLSEVKGRPVQFLIETKAHAYPRDVLHVIRSLAGCTDLGRPIPQVPLFVAPTIPPTSRQLLRDHQLAYCDTSGSIYIALPWTLYYVDRPAQPEARAGRRSIYRGSSARVLHALLLEPKRSWHVNELAQHVGVSVSTAHQVCTYLEDQLWMAKAGAGPKAVRRLHDPGALLDAWAAEHSLRGYTAHRFYRWTRRADELLRAVTDALVQANIDYALTLATGARFVAPHGTDLDHVWALVPAAASGTLAKVLQPAGIQAVDEGESVTLFATRDATPLLFRQSVQGLMIASDVQLYLDLSAWPKRGKEQAHHLRVERLGY